MELLKELCECSGIPGREERLREIVRRELEPVVDETRVDALGNLIATKRATKGRSPKRLMIAAHMDEIGFVVSHIDEKGLLRLVPLGGHDPRNMVAQRVTVCGTKRDLTGLLYPGLKPPHIQTDEERGKSLKVSDFYVDLYLPASRVKREVEVGTMVTLQRDFVEIGNGVSCKAMDDRLAVYVMIRAMQAAKSYGFETYAVATAQEEVGLRGAGVSAFGVEPDEVAGLPRIGVDGRPWFDEGTVEISLLVDPPITPPLRASLESVGLRIEGSDPRRGIIVGRIPVDRLFDLAALESVRRATPSSGA